MTFTGSFVVTGPDGPVAATAAFQVVAPTVVTPPARIDLSGATDAGAALSAWLDAHPRPQYQCVLPPGSKILANTGVTVTSPVHLVCTDAQIFQNAASTNRNNCILNVRASNCVFQDLTCIGNTVGQAVYNPALEGQHAVNIFSTFTNVVLQGTTTLQGVLGDCLYVGSSYTTNTPATNVTVTGVVDFQWAGRHGISVTNGVGFTLTATGQITGAARDWIDLEPATYTTKANRVLIDGQGALTASWGPGFDLIGAKGVGPVNNVTVRNVTALNPVTVSCTPPNGMTRHGWTIENLTGPTNWPASGSWPQFNMIRTANTYIGGCHLGPYLFGPTPQTRTPSTNARVQQWLETAGCANSTVEGNVWS